MKKRLEYLGGDTEGRMIKGKCKTLDKVLYASYQAAEASEIPNRYKQNDVKELPQFKCLINPNLNKQDYDEKIISTHYYNNLKNGSIIRWRGTDTVWLVYLQALTEDAYFRAEIRRARYTINFKDDNGEIVSVYAAVRGPVETKINYLEKGNFRTDIPNWSLNILMPASDIVLKNIDRYSRFVLKGTVWRVMAVDSISTPGIVEIVALENYINKDVDDMENELTFGLIEEKVDPNPDGLENYIDGKTFLKPGEIAEYSIVGMEQMLGTWEYDKKVICEIAYGKFQVKSSVSTQTYLRFVPFDTEIEPIEKIIVIESLF
ncbi:MAG: hypothetical protein K2M17_05020 [Bacilli bacterium]|nr:hypothetical protein [Bacilli bacterium]